MNQKNANNNNSELESAILSKPKLLSTFNLYNIDQRKLKLSRKAREKGEKKIKICSFE